jgi:hypothetical protein
MVSSGMLHRVDLVTTDVSEELRASFIRVTRIGELGTTLALCSSETSVVTRATRRNFPGDTILHSHRRENLKSYNMDTVCSVYPQGKLETTFFNSVTAANENFKSLEVFKKCNTSFGDSFSCAQSY